MNKETIKAVHDHFINELIDGSIDIGSIDSHTVDVIVDSEFKFVIWMANEVRGVRTYDGMWNFMQLTFTDIEKQKVWDVLYPVIFQHKKDVLLKQKQEELKKLTIELENEEA